MLSIPATIKLFLAVDPVDLRKSFHGLSSLAQSILQQDPVSGHWFVFFNRRRDRIKILAWDGTGFCIWYKRLERGTFELPAGDPPNVELTSSQLSLILEGIELSSVKQRPRFQLRPTGVTIVA